MECVKAGFNFKAAAQHEAALSQPQLPALSLRKWSSIMCLTCVMSHFCDPINSFDTWCWRLIKMEEKAPADLLWKRRIVWSLYVNGVLVSGLSLPIFIFPKFHLCLVNLLYIFKSTCFLLLLPFKILPSFLYLSVFSVFLVVCLVFDCLVIFNHVCVNLLAVCRLNTLSHPHL